jgi:hypothetical protein
VKDVLYTIRYVKNQLDGKPRIGTSKYKGVYWDKFRNKWNSRISHNHKTIHVGRFDSEKEAAKQYDLAAVKLYGIGNCFLNFNE